MLRETIRLALTIAALNDLEVKVGDVLNAYITAPITEKVWTVLGPEFGPDQGRSAVIVRALYGLKSAGAAFRAHLASCMRQMGYTSCKADPDLWLKATTRPDNGTHYYAYILCYVDDILCIHHDAMLVLNKINEYLPLKPDSVGDPDIYLGAKLRQTRLENGVWDRLCVTALSILTKIITASTLCPRRQRTHFAWDTNRSSTRLLLWTPMHHPTTNH